MPKMCHSFMGESSNKVRMNVWAELGLKRFADKADAQAEEVGGESDGSFSVNRHEDLEYFFLLSPLSHLSMSQPNTNVRAQERSSF